MTDHAKPSTLCAIGSTFYAPATFDGREWRRYVYTVDGHIWIAAEERWAESLTPIGEEPCPPEFIPPCPTCGQRWPR